MPFLLRIFIGQVPVKVFQLTSEVYFGSTTTPPIEVCRISTGTLCRKLFAISLFLVAHRKSTVKNIKCQLILDTKEPDLELVCVIFMHLSKEIPDQNNFTNKIHACFVLFDWDFHFSNP